MKCCIDCKNLESDYEWDGIDETVSFYCRLKAREDCPKNESDEKCDKYRPYKRKGYIPNYVEKMVF